MHVVRILDLRQYDSYRRRFRDVVYKNSSRQHGQDTPDNRGGFSVIDEACVRRRVNEVHGDTVVCEHIALFYSDLTRHPCAFWAFDSAIFDPPDPNPHNLVTPELVQKTTESGDTCHHNMHNVSDNRLKREYRAAEGRGELMLCIDGNLEEFSHERADQGKQLAYPGFQM